MHQVAAPVWNEIAESGMIKDPKIKTLMELGQQQLSEKLEKQADMLEKEGYTDSVIMAYQTVMPLLVEGPAIHAWVSEQNRPDLLAAFPKVNTVYEATHLVVKEYTLGVEEIESLMELITRTLQPQKDMSRP